VPTDKYPWMQFYTGEWLKDPELSLCTSATRGVWIDLICAMHELGRLGQLRGTAEQLARVARCSAAEILAALTDLQTTGAADVTERNGVFVVRNRRMSRDAKKRQSNAARQLRLRHSKCRADVAPMSRGRSQKSEVRIKSPPPTSPKESNGSGEPFKVGEGEEIFHPEGNPWSTIERSLRDLGLVDSAACLKAAQANGCEPWHVGALIGHFEAFPKAWTVNLLYARIKRLLPDDDPRKGWPEPSAEHRQFVEATLPPKPLPPSAAELKAANEAARVKAEAEHGATIDAMSDGDIDAAAAANAGVAARVGRLRRDQKDPRHDALVREYLLGKVRT
jgi:hypothetical protein